MVCYDWIDRHSQGVASLCGRGGGCDRCVLWCFVVGGPTSAFLNDGCMDFAGDVAVGVVYPAVFAGDVGVGVASPAIAGAASLANLAGDVAVGGV